MNQNAQTENLQQPGKDFQRPVNAPDIKCELMIIGLGISGMASAVFAANRGISVVQTGMTGEIIFASGLIDLMGVHPIQNNKTWEDPWAAIREVSKDIPGHPYARMQKKTIQKSLDEFTSFFGDAGFHYHGHQNRNVRLITSAGTIKQTYLVPRTMWHGVAALQEKAPCLIVDFHGLKDFSAFQIVSVLQKEWPGLHHCRVSIPGAGGKRNEVYSEHIARSLELPSNREKLSNNIRPVLKNIKAIGMPPVLGMTRTDQARSHLEELLGVPVFEIPAMPPSVTGLRLRETFEEHFHGEGIQTLYQKKVLRSRSLADGSFLFDVGTREKEVTVRAEGAILASGRFIGKGLAADRKHIYETIFGLPVYQPENRTGWHDKEFFSKNGHEINKAGIEIDNNFRPVGTSGKPVSQNLFAAGSILAHNDWKRMKCGSGVAIATAYGAVVSFHKHLRKK